MKVLFEMFETVGVKTTKENDTSTFRGPFLMIAEEDRSFIDQGLECVALDNCQEEFQEP